MLTGTYMSTFISREYLFNVNGGELTHAKISASFYIQESLYCYPFRHLLRVRTLSHNSTIKEIQYLGTKLSDCSCCSSEEMD